MNQLLAKVVVLAARRRELSSVRPRDDDKARLSHRPVCFRNPAFPIVTDGFC